uniref:Uncharacterized protein n=1 Tax=Ranid herpesvirus 4 TaxID=2849006 RepID=A0A8F3CIH3_9VIRU|nr:MAG: hypothetical protein [Ranid herpesvirus 4]
MADRYAHRMPPPFFDHNHDYRRFDYQEHRVALTDNWRPGPHEYGGRHYENKGNHMNPHQYNYQEGGRFPPRHHNPGFHNGPRYHTSPSPPNYPGHNYTDGDHHYRNGSPNMLPPPPPPPPPSRRYDPRKPMYMNSSRMNRNGPAYNAVSRKILKRAIRASSVMPEKRLPFRRRTKTRSRSKSRGHSRSFSRSKSRSRTRSRSQSRSHSRSRSRSGSASYNRIKRSKSKNRKHSVKRTTSKPRSRKDNFLRRKKSLSISPKRAKKETTPKISLLRQLSTSPSPAKEMQPLVEPVSTSKERIVGHIHRSKSRSSSRASSTVRSRHASPASSSSSSSSSSDSSSSDDENMEAGEIKEKRKLKLKNVPKKQPDLIAVQTQELSDIITQAKQILLSKEAGETLAKVVTVVTEIYKNVTDSSNAENCNIFTQLASISDVFKDYKDKAEKNSLLIEECNMLNIKIMDLATKQKELEEKYEKTDCELMKCTTKIKQIYQSLLGDIPEDEPVDLLAKLELHCTINKATEEMQDNVDKTCASTVQNILSLPMNIFDGIELPAPEDLDIDKQLPELKVIKRVERGRRKPKPEKQNTKLNVKKTDLETKTEPTEEKRKYRSNKNKYNKHSEDIIPMNTKEDCNPVNSTSPVSSFLKNNPEIVKTLKDVSLTHPPEITPVNNRVFSMSQLPQRTFNQL